MIILTSKFEKKNIQMDFPSKIEIQGKSNILRPNLTSQIIYPAQCETKQRHYGFRAIRSDKP